ncbi:MAG TPA: endonuclease MutS2 [Anaerolineaceae bacterium]|nr:endonuclease MutS2 [Anaerolineaceae bacterium]HPN51490.1 endonuclease MutS2 [Anaerolineaceae bacterium]
MDEKNLNTLEYFKILERLAAYASFSASAELARALRPAPSLELAKLLQQQTSEARRLLSVNADVSIGGATDIRPQVDLARHGGMLTPPDLLQVKNTLLAARTVVKSFSRAAETYPNLTAIVEQIPAFPNLAEQIGRTISDRGDILDSASPKLASIRGELKVAHDRLLARMQRFISDDKTQPMLQEALITQRNGRYVLPLRSDFKGRLRSIVHDQSASGATLFVEPLVVVEMNNRWRELQLMERDEERRILTELSLVVGQHAAEMNTLIEVLAELDLAFARAKYAEDLRAAEPVLLPFAAHPKPPHPGCVIRLYHARHPLLNPEKVVPIDVDLDPDVYSLVITGPNTGGKTVTLKTVGLLVLMAQSGLHIPAQSGSELSFFETVYADIGDEQSIEQSLSTFSGHVTNLVHILAVADARSLVIFDELGAGTDPQEGSALARAVLSHLLERRITSLVATHYPELKAFAHSMPGVVNASVEFNLETLRPTYHLTIGLPGRSNALAIAERLGLPQPIIQAARATIDPTDLHAEDLLDEIHRQRDLARAARAEAEKHQQQAEMIRAELSTRLERVEEERYAILEKARQQAEAETSALRLELDEARRALARARQPLEALQTVEKQVEEMEEKVEAPVERKVHRTGPRRTPARGPLRLGEKVILRNLNKEGVVTSLGENEVEVMVGVLRVRARLGDVRRKTEDEENEAEVAATVPAEAPRPSAQVPAQVFHASPGMELDLRGQRAEDALDRLDSYLEAAFLAGLPFVRIIHGKGTGRLRQVIREALQQSPHVKKWETGSEKEGGDGVTVAKLATD